MNQPPRTDQENLYIRRVNHVIDHIYTHLDADLTLESLAMVAGFSPFHFHRIFKTLTDETLSQFVWRVRIERGAMLLRTKPQLAVSDVALSVGFTSLAGFSRAFKQRFGLPPTRWMRFETSPERYHVQPGDVCPHDYVVNITTLPTQRLAYVRVDNAYADTQRIEDAYDRLLTWYQRRGGDLNQTRLYGMSQDDPDITPRELCRFDWCLTVPDGWRGDQDVAVRQFPTCQLASISMTGPIEEEMQVLTHLWHCWLPSSRYQPADLPAMEIYRRYPHETGWWDEFHIDCAVPIDPLRG